MTFENYLEQLDFDKLVQLWNEYASEFYSEHIYNDVEEFASIAENDGLELARKVFFGKVRLWDDHVYINGYGNFESCWDLESSPIAVLYLAEWLKEEEHEVYQEWIEDIFGEFSEHLAANVDTTELYKLWVEYEFEGEPASDDEVKDMFDVEILAADLIKDNHQLFQDWLEEQGNEEV